MDMQILKAMEKGNFERSNSRNEIGLCSRYKKEGA